MYDVLVYDEEHGQYVPAKDNLGKRVSCQSWSEAAGCVYRLTMNDPSQQYKVQYRTVRRGKVRR